jgi:pyruvate-formate lyase
MAGSVTSVASKTDILVKLGEPLGAGFMQEPNASLVERFASGLRIWAEVVDLQQYDGGLLYPAGRSVWNNEGMAAGWYYVTATSLNRDVFDSKLAHADETEREALAELERDWTNLVFPGGYTHSIPHYERVLADGLDGFADRVASGLDGAMRNEDIAKVGFYRAMGTVLETARTLHRRYVEEIARFDPADDAQRVNQAALLDAYQRVPFTPANTFFEALVATNFTFYLDGCDNHGRFDQYLGPYFERSMDAGELTRERAVDLVHAQWVNVDQSYGWNAAIGGTRSDGTNLSNGLTVVCLEAARGMRRPNLALRLGDSTPDAVWEAALDTISHGSGIPALYWDPNYFAAMDASEIPLPDGDRQHFAFGGCTELMVHGRSFVGSLDGDINLPEVLEKTVSQHLSTAPDFESFRDRYYEDIDADLEELTTRINRWQAEKAIFQPQPIRSLLIDDCVETGVEYSAGGARYNWSVINVMGLANAADSLTSIRSVVFEDNSASGAEVVTALQGNFTGTDELRGRLMQAPRYGNGQPEADDTTRELSEQVFNGLLRRRTWRGDAPFVPSCLMFTTYAHFGRQVGATPDGRGYHEPIADSAGPYQGRDTSGPTAMMRSVAGIDHEHAPGTLVVNMRLAKNHFIGLDQREKTKALLRTYFDMGGLQIQVNVIDQDLLCDAVAHPDRYGDLVVRVGGYSEYWANLEPALRESILLRTEH